VLARKKRATGRLPAVVKLALGLLGGLCFCGATGLLEPINVASSSALRTRCAARLQSSIGWAAWRRPSFPLGLLAAPIL